MAKGRVGGAHSKIRGKVGGFIYQIKKDANGQLMQHVYSQSETREYSNTEPQISARMRMGMVHRMYRHLSPLIKESFIGLPKGTLQLQHFTKINYPLLTEDYNLPDNAPRSFDWIAKRNMAAPAGRWIIAQGVLPALSGFRLEYEENFDGMISLVWDDVLPNTTLRQLFTVMNINPGDLIYIFSYAREYYNPDDMDASKLANVNSIIDLIKIEVHGAEYLDKQISSINLDDVFKSDDKWYFNASYSRYYRTFDLLAMRPRSTKQYQVACIAPLTVRQSAGTIMWSTAQFQWGDGFYDERYPMHSPAEVYESWAAK